VASDWLVDDEATATLVSYFATGVAAGQKGGGAADYAAALQAAKRGLRNNDEHPQWKQPFYWGPLVLVGPN
jgi:CHAT domain-containing protein